jgi:membrane associated rhomboid family serine protease
MADDGQESRSPAHPARGAARDARTLHAFQVFFALHCLGFLGVLLARDPPLRTFVDGFALTGDGSQAPWQLATYAFLHQNPIELLVSAGLLLTIGAQVEAALGTARFALVYLGSIVAVGLGAVGLEALAGDAATSNAPIFLGGLGGAGALLAAYALAFPERRTLGLMPAPAFFCSSALFLAFVVRWFDGEPTRHLVELVQGTLSNDQWLERQLADGAHPVAALPHAFGVLAGASTYALDSVASQACARARVRREIRVLEEELEARARVEQLLEKISREGLSALSWRERKFLQYASRFYPPAVTSEGP